MNNITNHFGQYQQQNLVEEVGTGFPMLTAMTTAADTADEDKAPSYLHLNSLNYFTLYNDPIH